MKKFLLILVLITPIVFFAQAKKKVTPRKKPATSQQLAELPGFKVFGIGFETTREKYEQELAKKGYTKPSKFSNYDEYTVEFAGHNNCKFSIYYNVTTDSITNIKILFPYETYDKAGDAQYEIVKQLDAKYGKSERKDDLSDFYKLLGEYHHGQVENKWVYNGIKIYAICLWNSESNKAGDNYFYLNYFTNAKRTSEIKPNDDL